MLARGGQPLGCCDHLLAMTEQGHKRDCQTEGDRCGNGRAASAEADEEEERSEHVPAQGMKE